MHWKTGERFSQAAGTLKRRTDRMDKKDKTDTIGTIHEGIVVGNIYGKRDEAGNIKDGDEGGE